MQCTVISETILSVHLRTAVLPPPRTSALQYCTVMDYSEMILVYIYRTFKKKLV